MSDPLVCLSRRTFIRVTGSTIGVSAFASNLGCYPGGKNMEDTDLMTDRLIITCSGRMISKSVGIPLTELPVAYVSMAQRKVFVDPEFRDRASWLLRAHISVSTWHWRIPLPDDPEGVPIGAGGHGSRIRGTPNP